jgi:hypothetical protein
MPAEHGAIDFVRELQPVLESLEARKKRRSSGNHGFSPSPTPSPRSHLVFSTSSGGATTSSAGSTTPSPPVVPKASSQLAVKELAACCNSPIANVEAKIWPGAELQLAWRRCPEVECGRRIGHVEMDGALFVSLLVLLLDGGHSFFVFLVDAGASRPRAPRRHGQSGDGRESLVQHQWVRGVGGRIGGPEVVATAC